MHFPLKSCPENQRTKKIKNKMKNKAHDVISGSSQEASLFPTLSSAR